jgi:HAE1 family hydrophobic/amphiphilic exporter-1
MALFSIATPFIKRPVLTTVCTIIILLVGGVCIPLLPINYLPDISPITISVNSQYTGADVETVESTVTSVLEREINGVEDMDYMSSQSFAGNSQVSISFPSNTERNINQVNVQNRVAQVVPQLPGPVQQRGVATRAASTSILQVYGFFAENGEYDSLFISNYIDLNVIDAIRRVPGVGDATVFGQKQTSMRVWLDPAALQSRGLTTLDVINALRSQNIVIGAGSIGQEPVPEGQSIELPLRIQGQFSTAAEFENLVLRSSPGGDLIRLRDVGRAELGAENYLSNAFIGDQEGVGIAIYQLPGSNALDVADSIRAVLSELRQGFPPGLTDVLVFDTTEFITVSIREVFITLLQAIALVILIIFIFLQDWRTTLIPAVAIPVALVGALAFAFIMGFSLNSLTLFGLILATGLVVDDAIVIVEAVTAKMQEGMTAREAALESMNELSGAVISTSLVLLAVFIPVAFFPGTTGALYQQFALIIAFSVVVSTFNAISFSPSMSAVLLRPQQPTGGPLGWVFDKFNQGLAWIKDRYTGFVEFLIRIRYIVIAVFVVGLLLTLQMFRSVPTGFVPTEDQGALIGIVQAPDGVALNYTDRVLRQVTSIFEETPEVERVFTVSGAGLEGRGSNQGLFFARLKPWDERSGRGQDVISLAGRLNQQFAQIQEAIVAAFAPPAIPGFSATGELELQLQDRTNGQLTLDEFLQNAREILATANESPAIRSARTQFTVGSPQLEIDIDRSRLAALNVDFQQAMQTIGTAIGSAYVNDFTVGTRSYRVFVQAEGDFRNSPADIQRFDVRARDGTMVPIGDLATITPVTGPQIITRFNGYRAIKLQVSPTSGSGAAIAAMDEVVQAKALPGIGSNWIGLAKEEIAAGSLGALIFLFGIIMVFLTLSAQYESYVDPIIILLTVPLALLGALLFIAARGLLNDVYANVAFVMLIGLASKNAILIVEFANQAKAEGLSIVKAAQRAAEERFRPILMTAVSTLVGFFPLVVATGAGAASRISIGTTLFGGLLISTLLSFLFVPVLYVVIKSLEAQLLGSKKSPTTFPPSPSSGGSEPEPQPPLPHTDGGESQPVMPGTNSDAGSATVTPNGTDQPHVGEAEPVSHHPNGDTGENLPESPGEIDQPESIPQHFQEGSNPA